MVCFRSSVGSRGNAPASPPSKPRRFRIATINIRNFRKKQASPRFPRRKNTLPDPNGAYRPAASCGARPAPAPEITRPQPAEHAQPQLTKPPGRSLRSTPRRKPTSGPPSLPDIRPFGSEPSGPSDPQLIETQLPKSPGRSLRSTPSPSSRDHPAAACGAHPAPTNETTRPQPAEHAAAQADERASAGGGCGPRDSEESHPFHSATPSDPPQPRPPAARLLFSARRAPRHTGPPRKTPGTPHPATRHPTTRRSRCRSAERHRPVSLPKGASGNRRQRQPGRSPARAFHSDAFRQPPSASAAFRYRPTTASSSSTVTGSRRSPSMRHPSSVTSRSSSMRMPPKSR